MSKSLNHIDEYYQLINILGEDKIEKAYFIMRSRKFSFATLYHFMRDEKIRKSIKDGIPPIEIAAANRVSKMTVYRYLKDHLKK